MAGFGRNEAVDSGGFRGLIPDNTTIAALVIDGDASLIKLKNGDNAGKTARIFKPVVECLIGKYKGGRVYGDVWCNVEPDPAGGEPHVFGSHMTFCDICDITGTKEEDGSYPTAANEAEAKAIAQRFVGGFVLVTVGTEEYPKRDGSTGIKNTIKSVSAMTDEQKEQLADAAVKTQEKMARYLAKKNVAAGGDGFSDDIDDDDQPF